MEPKTLAEVAAITGGVLSDAPSIDGRIGPDVVIDSRLATPGSLFVALAGDRVDGHDYLDAAAARGACAALVTRPVVSSGLPQVVVPDAVGALSALARRVVDEGRAGGLVVVGVTGSSGKTSTKDLISQVLSAAAPTIAPPGSFNNEIGAPLTACRVGATTRFLVSEMGARGAGHIRHLAGITPPDIGAVLNVGHAHVGEFGSVAGIAQAKGELVEALNADGWAVLNADDPLVIAMADRTRARIAAFSLEQDPADTGADLRVWATDIAGDERQRFSFVLHTEGVDGHAQAGVALGVHGRHNVANALAAAAVGVAAGLDLGVVADTLSAAQARSPFRMELTERADGLLVLNDAYNANPDSVAAALHALAGLRRPGGRLVAALGDMLELGDSADAAHHEVGRLAAALGVDDVAVVGSFGHATLAGVAEEGGAGHYLESKEELSAYLRPRVGDRDVVLVKASRGLALETVAADLLAEDEGETHP